jgi:glycogen phosphorylase
MSHAGYERARELSAWKARVRDAWERVQVVDVEGDVTAADVGIDREVAATVCLGELSTDDIAVQLAHGRVGANNELVDPEVTEMKADHCVEQTCVYRGGFTTDAAGLYGFTVRVIPSHPDLSNQMDLGLVTWAS